MPQRLADATDFTLIIPTYNRPGFLGRLLRYCQGRFPKIMVLDSSNADGLSENRDLISALGGGIEYRVYDTDIRPTEKLLDGLGAVSTPYFAFCADDDIVFPDGAMAALDVLRAHPEYAGVDGIYLNFSSAERTVNVGIEYSGSGIGEEHPVARVFRLLQNYESLFYGVYRVQDVLPIFRGLTTLPSLHFQELFQSAAVLLLGKTYRIPFFYAGRQQCEPAEPSREKWQTYYWFAENRNEFLEHYKSYRTALLEFYQKYGRSPRLNTEHFIQAMDLAHATFFSKNCPDEYFYGIVQSYCPGDSYKGADDGNILAQLKSPLRRRLEAKVVRVVNSIGMVVKAAFLPWHLSSLNREIKRQFGSSYECVLAKRLAWVSGKSEFRQAYKELCCYLAG